MRPDIHFFNRTGEEEEDDKLEDEDDVGVQQDAKSKKGSLTELRVEYSKRRVDENHFGPISYTEVEGARNEEPWVVCLWSGNKR